MHLTYPRNELHHSTVIPGESGVAGAPGTETKVTIRPVYPNPKLIRGEYPRAWPIEVLTRADGSQDFEFCLDGEWHRLPLSAVEHAATEVAIASCADIPPLNYAQGVALLLAALRKQNWLVRPPRLADDPNYDRHSQDI